MIRFIKIRLLKVLLSLILIDNKDTGYFDRAYHYIKIVAKVAPIAFFIEVFSHWFMDNKDFAAAIIIVITVNMFLGAYMHFKKGTFSWKTFILKTMTMTVVINITYLVLELIISRAGENLIADTFRVTLQVATLLYPGSKIMKNIFVLSKGEHPPKWIMQKIYNFQSNGDLHSFLSTDDNKESESDHDFND